MMSRDCRRDVIVGGDSCQLRHLGVVQSGTMRITHEDGTEVELGPGDTYVIEPRSEEHTSELQSHRDLHSFPTRRSSDLSCDIWALSSRGRCGSLMRTAPRLSSGPAIRT